MMKTLVVVFGLLALVDMSMAYHDTTGLCAPNPCNGLDCHLNSTEGYTCDCQTHVSGTFGGHCEHNVTNSGCDPLDAVYCNTCREANEADCLENAKRVRCNMNDPVCETTTHANSNGEVDTYIVTCTQRDSCDARSLGPHTKVCTELGGGTHNNICTTCELGSCCDTGCAPGKTLCCFTCHARNDIACWLCGHYVPCPSTCTCFYEYIISEHTGRHNRVRRGCMERNTCPADSKGYNKTPKCTDGNSPHCSTCDNGAYYPAPPLPTRPPSICEAPAYGICHCCGDPHCGTFDGKEFNFGGVGCWSVFTRDNCSDGNVTGDPNFQILIRTHERGPPHAGKWRVDAVKIILGNTHLFLGNKKGEYGFNMDVETSKFVDCQIPNPALPVPEMTNMAAYSNEQTVTVWVNMSCGDVQVNWDFVDDVSVWVPVGCKTLMCGLCGDFNDDPDSGDYILGPFATACNADNPLNLDAGQLAMNSYALGVSWYGEDSHNDQCHADCPHPVPG